MADAKSKRSERARGKSEAVFEVHGKRLVCSRSSLYLFGQESRVRRACVRIVTHPWFERLVLLLILFSDGAARKHSRDADDVRHPSVPGAAASQEHLCFARAPAPGGEPAQICASAVERACLAAVHLHRLRDIRHPDVRGQAALSVSPNAVPGYHGLRGEAGWP